jgi:ADP-ribosylglycohydrolase
MIHSNPLMLLRIAQGDAYAAAVEYVKPSEHKELFEQSLKFERYLKHPTHSLGVGQYTDDTQMSIAVAEVMLDGKRYSRAFIDAFVRCFKRDPRDGYARGFQSFLEAVKDTDHFIAQIKPFSDKNGAAMRSVPIGVLSDAKEIMAVAEANANTTHRTPIGVWSSQAVALMSHFALYVDEPFEAIGEFVESYLPGFIKDVVDVRPGRVSAPDLTLKTIRAIYHGLMSPSYVDVMVRIINWGGDTDTVAAVVFGIGSARWQQELPPGIENGLEDGEYGRRFLIELGEKLMKRYR